MTQDILERPTSAPATTREDELLLGKLEAIHQRNREKEWRATTDQLNALREEFAKEQREILSPDVREKIQGSIVRGGDPRGPGLRFQSLAKAREYGVDLIRLKSLHDRLHGKFNEIVKDHTAFTVHENVVGTLADVLQIATDPLLPSGPRQGKALLPALQRVVGPIPTEPGQRRRDGHRELLLSRRQYGAARGAVVGAQS